MMRSRIIGFNTQHCLIAFFKSISISCTSETQFACTVIRNCIRQWKEKCMLSVLCRSQEFLVYTWFKTLSIAFIFRDPKQALWKEQDDHCIYRDITDISNSGKLYWQHCFQMFKIQIQVLQQNCYLTISTVILLNPSAVNLWMEVCYESQYDKNLEALYLSETHVWDTKQHSNRRRTITNSWDLCQYFYLHGYCCCP